MSNRILKAERKKENKDFYSDDVVASNEVLVLGFVNVGANYVMNDDLGGLETIEQDRTPCSATDLPKQGKFGRVFWR